MRRGLQKLAMFAMVVMFGGLFEVSAAGPPTTTIPVTVTLADTQGFYPLRVQSDTAGAYINSATVGSVITTDKSGSDWQLTTYYRSKGRYAPSSRRVLFDLTEQAAPGLFPTPISAPTYMSAHLIAKCSLVGVNMLKLATGQSALCPGGFRFWAPNGQWYRLSFQPDNYPHVDRLKVTCTSSDATGCKVWTISSSGTQLTGDDPNPKSLNKLLLIDEGGIILEEGGDYYLSFSITIAR